MRFEQLDSVAQCALATLAGLIYGTATGAITSSVGSSILTHFNATNDMTELASIGAVGGAVLGGCCGFFGQAAVIAAKRLPKVNMETLPLHMMLSEILYCLIGYAILHPALSIERAICAFVIGGAVMNYPLLLGSWIPRRLFCPETMIEPEEIPFNTGYSNV